MATFLSVYWFLLKFTWGASITFALITGYLRVKLFKKDPQFKSDILGYDKWVKQTLRGETGAKPVPLSTMLKFVFCELFIPFKMVYAQINDLFFYISDNKVFAEFLKRRISSEKYHIFKLIDSKQYIELLNKKRQDEIEVSEDGETTTITRVVTVGNGTTHKNVDVTKLLKTHGVNLLKPDDPELYEGMSQEEREVFNNIRRSLKQMIEDTDAEPNGQNVEMHYKEITDTPDTPETSEKSDDTETKK